MTIWPLVTRVSPHIYLGRSQMVLFWLGIITVIMLSQISIKGLSHRLASSTVFERHASYFSTRNKIVLCPISVWKVCCSMAVKLRKLSKKLQKTQAFIIVWDIMMTDQHSIGEDIVKKHSTLDRTYTCSGKKRPMPGECKATLNTKWEVNN